MGVVKVIELLSQSESSWEDATRKALEQASKTVRNIKSIYVKEFQAIVEDDQITQYRVNCKVSFSLDGSADQQEQDRKSTRLNSSHVAISYAVFCVKKKMTRIESAAV